MRPLKEYMEYRDFRFYEENKNQKPISVQYIKSSLSTSHLAKIFQNNVMLRKHDSTFKFVI